MRLDSNADRFFSFSFAVSEAVILRTLSYQEAWEMVNFTTLFVPVNA
jgi:hypothetical protein